MKTKAADRKFMARAVPAQNIEIARAEGSRFYDVNNKEYIDFLMGWCVGNLGWGNPVLKKALKQFDGPEYVYPGLLYKPWPELAELLASCVPGKLVRSFRTTGGTEAVEAAMQISMLYTGRKEFISIEGAYHGNSLAAISLGDSEMKKRMNLLDKCHKIELPLDKKSLKKIERRLRSKEIAALIMEPVINSLGVEIPDKDWLQGVRKMCKKYGTLFVADEVASGFGRTGKLFACEHFEIDPDILCLAKALSGGYAAIGAAMTTEKIAKKVEKNVSLYSTFGWHPVSVHQALTSLRYILEKKNELLTNVEEMSQLFRTRLSQMPFKNKHLNIIGLSIGIDAGSEKKASAIVERCLKNGLLIGSSENHIVMFPALNIDKETAEKGLDILEKAVM